MPRLQQCGKIDNICAIHSRRFHASLLQPPYPTPSYVELMGFRVARTSMRHMLNESSRDFTYYRDKGWFESDYYYLARLGVLKKATGSLVDSITASMTRKWEP